MPLVTPHHIDNGWDKQLASTTTRQTGTDAPTDERRFGTDWAHQTNGILSTDDRNVLLRQFVQGFRASIPGRLRLAVGLHPGRHHWIDPELLTPPDSALARDTLDTARELMTPGVLAHCQRTYAFAAALGAVDRLSFDREAVYVAAMLHDAVWPSVTPGVDFTIACAQVADQVTERHHVDGERQTLISDAICMHTAPGITLDEGAEAYLVATAAALEVVGLRAWDLPNEIRAQIVEQFPRTGFKRECAHRVRQESRMVPHGRLWYFRHFGLSDLSIALAPFKE